MEDSKILQIFSIFCVVFLIENASCFLVGKSLHLHRKELGQSIRESGKSLQQALRELRDSKRRAPTEPYNHVVEKSVSSSAQKTSPIEKKALARVSFKECKLDFGLRMDCGHYGIDEEGCYKRECCWGETEEEDVPWCYHSLPTMGKQCSLDKTERQECGFYGIRKEQCLAQDCCWQPTNDNSVPWCFHELRVPIFEGECGVPARVPSVMSRIVGGVEATPNTWPWMVSLQIDQGHFCGGSLINNQWIVSAAHCEPAFNWGSDKEIVLGMHSQTEDESTKVRIQVDKLFSHEDYGRNSGMDNDIMLIKLKHPVEFTDAISPVCIPEKDAPVSPGRRSYTTGWGHLQAGGNAPDKLQQVMVPIVDPAVCNAEGWYDGQVDDTMICAGYEEGGRDSCQGDSGGPLVSLVNSKWTLVGVVSWGYGCADDKKPGIYAKTSKYNKWIEDTINDNL